MVIFSIICLVVIILGLQHIVNWIWRKFNEDDGLFMLALFATFVSLIISAVCIKYIIIWGKALV